MILHNPIYSTTVMLPGQLPQDTSVVVNLNDSTTFRDEGLVTDTSNTLVSPVSRFTLDQIDSIFMITDRRQQEIDSVRAEEETARARPEQINTPVYIDRDKVPYNLKDEDPDFSSTFHFMEQLRGKHYSLKDTQKAIFIETGSENEAMSTFSETPASQPFGDESGEINRTGNPGWLLAAIILILILIAWLKLFYNKFFDQTLQSLYNYQLSAKVFRDQNIFSRRVATVLNFNFIMTAGLFCFLVSNYYGISIFTGSSFLRYFEFCVLIAVFLLARYIITRLTGMIFNKDHLFKDYIHQILIAYKSLGVYLILIIIGLAYSPAEMKIYLIYAGSILAAIAYLTRIIKGFQIIFRKDVLLIYLILYLCTLEILPILVVYRYFSSFL